MMQNVVDDLFQIGECVVGRQVHEAVCVYVMTNRGQAILIDCGSHLHRQVVMEELTDVLDGAEPAYVFLTHSELPHSGNLQKIVDRWPDIQVITSSILLKYIEIAPIMPLDQIIPIAPGERRGFAGRELRFVNALLKDQPGSQWIFDPQTGTMFTGDGFGYYHPPGSCALFSDQLEGGVPKEYFSEYHRHAFRFLRWTVPGKLNAAIDQLLAEYRVEIIAPTHGNAIRGDIPAHVEKLKDTITEICAAYLADAPPRTTPG